MAATLLFTRIETTDLFQFGIRSFLILAAFAKNCGAVFRKMDACLRNNRPFSFFIKRNKNVGCHLATPFGRDGEEYGNLSF